MSKNKDIHQKNEQLNDHRIILEFIQNFLKENHISSKILISPDSFDPSIDLYFRSNILSNSEYAPELFSRRIADLCTSNTILCIMDEFSCEYILMKLPDYDYPVYYVIGPFTYEPMTEEKIIQLFDKHKFPVPLYNNVYLYYSSLPYVPSFAFFQNLIRCIGNSLWGGPEHYHLKFVHTDQYNPTPYAADSALPNSDAVKYIENRYECENKLMEYISVGKADSALETLSQFYRYDFSQRISNPLRDKQNKLIILNTLCRKAAQAGKVSPFYLDQLSTKYALKIEAATSNRALDELTEEMIRRYCILVKSYSLKSYSTPIQNVISYISMNLTEDLRLSSIADKFALSSNYLSGLFKKEVKVTLTEYVNMQRIDYSIYLLNTTMLPIQSVAELSGFLDVNYYIRLFKKYKQMTPKQYQKMIQNN